MELKGVRPSVMVKGNTQICNVSCTTGAEFFDLEQSSSVILLVNGCNAINFWPHIIIIFTYDSSKEVIVPVWCAPLFLLQS